MKETSLEQFGRSTGEQIDKMTPEQIRDEKEEAEWEAEEKRKEAAAVQQKLADEKEARHQIWLQKRAAKQTDSQKISEGSIKT